MNIYVSHSRSFDYKTKLYQPIRSSNLNKVHNFILPHEDEGTPFVTKELFQAKKCDLILAEVSYPTTGQGIELGWADIFEIPIVCLYKEDAKISSSLSFISKKLLMYTSKENMIEDIEEVLKSYA